jgi:hypothetical protein
VLAICERSVFRSANVFARSVWNRTPKCDSVSLSNVHGPFSGSPMPRSNANSLSWRRQPRRSIASGINNLISCTSEAWTSASTPTLRRLKSAFNPKARTLRRGFHAVPPDKRRARQLQLWHGAVAALVESGNYQLVPLMTIQHCVFGSRDQINGTGRQRETCRDRSSSPRYVPSMLNFNEWKGAGGDT